MLTKLIFDAPCKIWHVSLTHKSMDILIVSDTKQDITSVELKIVDNWKLCLRTVGIVTSYVGSALQYG